MEQVLQNNEKFLHTFVIINSVSRKFQYFKIVTRYWGVSVF